jgi:tetratricopeptide (TPR) repeat protein
MGFRFYRRVRVLPGVYLNMGKQGTSMSFGPRGLKTTIGPKGVRHSFGIPGTGLSYQTPYRKLGESSSPQRNPKRKLSPEEAAQISIQNDYQKLNLGFFAKLTCPKEEKELAQGVQAFLLQDYVQAEAHLQKASCYADGAFTLGCVYLNTNRFVDAEKMLSLAEQLPAQIGVFFKKYNLDMTVHLAVSPFYEADFEPNALTSYLAHVEVLQHLNRYADACNLLLGLYKSLPQNLDVLISLADIVLEREPTNIQWMNAIVNMTKNIDNDSYAHAVLMMYKAEAFDNLGMIDAAITLLSTILRKKTGRPGAFLLEVQFQRGVLYSKIGKNTNAIKDLNAVYAIDPSYANVSQLLAQLKP